MQRGTLYHLRNLINHRNVTNKCMNACEDIFETVVEGHVIACALQLLGMSGVNDLPTQTITSHEAWMMDDIERRRILMDTTTQIVEENVDLSTNFSPESTSGHEISTVCICM